MKIKINEIKIMFSQFKNITKYFLEYYIFAVAFPKRESPHPQSGSSSEKCLPPINGPLSPTSSTPHNFHFRINGINNMISTMSEQLVLNVQRQSRAEVRTTIQLIAKWTCYTRGLKIKLFNVFPINKII